jgi:Ca-activated chloride channel family protein
MSAAIAPVLEPRDHARIALKYVQVDATLRGLLSEITVTQIYRNLERHNIEAVYTFPLPLDAVLLGLELTINGRTLTGTVKAQIDAEADYERALDDGNSAVLLEQVQPGLFTLNLANLLADETVRIRFRYTQLHHWNGDRLRFHLPTTVAPRYGDPGSGGLAPHQTPETVLSAEYGFSLTLTIEGVLARAGFECPSHPISVEDGPETRVLRLSGGTRLMDRDFVLVVREPDEAGTEGLWAPDGDGVVCLAPFHPHLADRRADLAPPRCLKLVVDCSGSMAGDSIAQARVALEEILSLLRPIDRFNLIAFGSTSRSLWSNTVPADHRHLREARAYLSRLNADMGGTEIGAALNLAYRSGDRSEITPDLFLITDGEVWDQAAVIEQAACSGHRIFTVGVGSAVAESFVRGIAERTGGACELVSPRENMAERIVRHARRIHQPKARSLHIHWPTMPLRQSPAKISNVFDGDTLHLFAWLPSAPDGEARLEVTFEDGQRLNRTVRFSRASHVTGGPEDILPRMGAWSRLAELGDHEARQIAESYQLVTAQTSCVLVHEREATKKAETIPVLRKVPQVLAAGWGGMGRERCDLVMRNPCPATPAGAPFRMLQLAPDDDRAGTESFALRSPTPLPHAPRRSITSLVDALNTRYPGTDAVALDLFGFSELVELGLDEDLAETLLDLVGENVSEQEVLVAFLDCLRDRRAADGLSRYVRRLIRKAATDAGIEPAIWAEVAGQMDDWGL